MDAIDKIAAAVMYEGYVLWPYRRSAPKNRQRWTFGALFPRVFSETAGTHDPWQMQTQCLVRGAAPTVRVRVRFLHVVQRQIVRREPDGTRRPVDELSAAGERYLTWEEATEREIVVSEVRPDENLARARCEIRIPPGRLEEPIRDAQGRTVGAVVRSWDELVGEVEAYAEQRGREVHRVTVRISNHGPWEGSGRQETLRRALLSTHTLLSVEGGEFLSLTDPPGAVQAAAAECENRHTWPVLVGEPGQADTLLSAPIILSDYPQVAPESQGDLFDGTEIDQLLLLNVLSLTDEEKREVRASDPRTREILHRAESLTAEDFLRLNGAIRDFRVLRPVPDDPFPVLFATPGPERFGGVEHPAPECVTVNGMEIRKGSRVRLRPHAGRDLMDVALAGRSAMVEAVEQDYEERVHVAVVVEDDPGRELGEARMMGHRFFFAPDELEPLDDRPARQP